jgi:hypothetical protein
MVAVCFPPQRTLDRGCVMSGSKAVFRRCPRHVCLYPKSGAKADIPALRIRAISGHSRAFRKCLLYPQKRTSLSAIAWYFTSDGTSRKSPQVTWTWPHVQINVRASP